MGQTASKKLIASVSARVDEMAVEYGMVCPECLMRTGMSSFLAKKEGVMVCGKNPEHRYKVDKDGMLRSV